MSDAHTAVLFDIDGTQVDSNYLHVHAWYRAFNEVGVDAESWRIHRCIGMDGEKLLDTVASDASDADRKKAQELHSRFYRETSSLLKVLPGTHDLLKMVADKGFQVVLATSAPEDELSMLRDLLDVEEILSAVTSSEDVETAKPEPGIVDVALSRAGVPARSAVFVGDSAWDAKASVRAGVTCIGVRSGGVAESELRDAGATFVCDGPHDLMDRFAESPLGQLDG